MPSFAAYEHKERLRGGYSIWLTKASTAFGFARQIKYGGPFRYVRIGTAMNLRHGCLPIAFADLPPRALDEEAIEEEDLEELAELEELEKELEDEKDDPNCKCQLGGTDEEFLESWDAPWAWP